MIIINGKESDGKNLTLDSGFNFGQGVFETILIKNKPVFLDEHINRLITGIHMLDIQNTINKEYILEVIDKFNISNCALKIIVTDKNVVVITRNINYKDRDYIEGFKLKTTNVRRNPFSTITYTKSLNFAENIIEKKKVLKDGFNEVLFLNIYNEIAEGSISNIFFVKDNSIFTPSVECGILEGIMRKWVVNNFEVNVGRFGIEDIKSADEVFITNSIIGIMKVIRIDETSYLSFKKVENIRSSFLDYLKLYE